MLPHYAAAAVRRTTVTQAPQENALLLEDGTSLLLESGGALLLE